MQKNYTPIDLHKLLSKHTNAKTTLPYPDDTSHDLLKWLHLAEVCLDSDEVDPGASTTPSAPELDSDAA